MEYNGLDLSLRGGNTTDTAVSCEKQCEPTMRRIPKRPRGKNFSRAEECILYQLVDDHKDVLLNKKSDAATWKLKSETWAKVSEEFCTQTGVVRSWEALRDKYTNTKRKERRYNGDKMTQCSPSEEANDAIESCDPSITEYNGSNYQAPSELQYEVNYSESSQDGKNNFWEEKLSMIKMQRNYYRDENARLAEKHSIEMQKQQAELEGRRLKNQLLELEIEERKKRG